MSDFEAKMHQNPKFGWGSAPDSAGGAYSAPPDPLIGFEGPTSKGRGVEGIEGEGTGREGMGRECCGVQKILKIDPVQAPIVGDPGAQTTEQAIKHCLSTLLGTSISQTPLTLPSNLRRSGMQPFVLY